MRTQKRPIRERFYGGLCRFVDGAVGVLSPSAALRRQAHRDLVKLHQKQQSRGYSRTPEGADTGDIRSGKWRGTASDGSCIDNLTREELRSRSQELYTDFPYIKGAVDHRVDNVVGRGINPEPTIKPTEGVIDESSAKDLNRQLKTLFTRWAKRAGRRGRTNLKQIQRQAERCYLRDGEAFIVASLTGKQSIPLELEVIAPDRVETPPNKEDDPSVNAGIKYKLDAKGNVEEIIGYYVRCAEDLDCVLTGDDYQYFSAEQVFHLFEEIFPGQRRGLPWCFATLNDARDFKDYKEAVIINAQVSACVSMIISTRDPNGSASAQRNTNRVQNISPGQIVYQEDVDQISTLTPSQPTTTYGMFADQNLQMIAAGLSYPVGWVSRDKSKSTYSSSKAEEIDGIVPIRCDQDLIECAFLCPLWELFTDLCVLLELVDVDPVDYQANEDVYTDHKWKPPGRQWLDPPKEIKALVEAKNNNLMTHEEIVGAMGKDSDEVFERRSVERQAERDFDIEPRDISRPTENESVITDGENESEQSD